ncbi:MAG: hypothetical protein KIH80_003835 [Flavobacteriia bacterium]|nr:hypothetical protein [Flavobacteriia bacterium]
MKKLCILLFLPLFAFGQNISINPRDFNSGNIELTRAVNLNRNIKGSPYLSDEFTVSTISFTDGKEYKGLLRYNIYKDVFELKSKNDQEIYELKLKQNVKVRHLNKIFEAKTLSDQEITSTFEILVEPRPFALFKFHKKVIKEPRRGGIAMPTSNQGSDNDAYWSDQSFFIIMKNNKVYQIENSHNKLMKSGLVNPDIYKKIIKEKKYKLDKQSEIIELINKLNSY